MKRPPITFAVLAMLLAVAGAWLALRSDAPTLAPDDAVTEPEPAAPPVRTLVPPGEATVAPTLAPTIPPPPAPTPIATAPLPPTLLELPGGKVTMGLDAALLVATARTLAPQRENEQQAILRHCVSELGVVTFPVERCYLGRHPVTNAEYAVYVEQTGARFPYHWWSEGRKDDFQSRERILEVAKLTSSFDKNVTYWEWNWKTLPCAIPPDKRNHPVTNVSWADAVAYATWAGMRLPTEAEWTLAATGGKPKTYLLGDVWDDRWLEPLGLERAADRRGTRPVGSHTGAASGPYGHDDMAGHVWEWMFDNPGYVPRANREDFTREFEALKQLVGTPDLFASFTDDHRLLKGGSFLSAMSPVQMRLGVRAHAVTTEVQPAAGFRVAKSVMPARDMSRARVHREYDSSIFGRHKPNLDDQTGIERYTLADGMVRGYAALSVIPISDLGYDERAPENRRTDTVEKSRQTPLIIGTLITTEKLCSPKLDPGIYTIYYRAKGLPDELTQALKVGQRELVGGTRGEEATVGSDWRTTVAKYSVTEQEVREHGHKLTTLRMREGEYAFRVDENLYLFRNNGDATGGEGKFVGHLGTGQKLESRGGYRGASVRVAGEDGQPVATFMFGAPTTGARHFAFTLRLVIDEPADAAHPWRIPPE